MRRNEFVNRDFNNALVRSRFWSGYGYPLYYGYWNPYLGNSVYPYTTGYGYNPGYITRLAPSSPSGYSYAQAYPYPVPGDGRRYPVATPAPYSYDPSAIYGGYALSGITAAPNNSRYRGRRGLRAGGHERPSDSGNGATIVVQGAVGPCRCEAFMTGPTKRRRPAKPGPF